MEENYQNHTHDNAPAEATTTNTLPEGDNKALRAIANTLSGVFSPLLIPTYALAMAMWMTPLAQVPERNRFVVCLITFVITSVIPLGTILFLIRSGKVSDAAISKPSERGIPYAVTILCYAAAVAYLYFANAPGWLYMFFAGAGVAAIIDALITIVWKISAHTTSMGGLFAVVLYIGLSRQAVVAILPWIIIVLLLCGMVGAARIYLGRHTPMQVYAGWLVGLIVSYAFMCMA